MVRIGVVTFPGTLDARMQRGPFAWPGLSLCRCGTPRPIWLGSTPSSFREASLMVITCVQELWLLPRQ